MRYLFGEGRVEFEEIQWHLYAIGFLLGYLHLHGLRTITSASTSSTTG